MAVNQRISLKDIDISINGDIIGGSEELSATWNADDVFAHEGGSYLPAEIIDGKITITGTLTTAWLNNDILKLIFPKSGLKPEITISGKLNNGKTPSRNVTIFGAKFNAPDINGFGLDDYAKNSLPFNATGWDFE